MGWIDWLIVIIPTAMVMMLGMYSRKYVHGVADFLSAGRCAGRYVLSMGDVASALAVTGLIAYVEIHYKTGFAITFWNREGAFTNPRIRVATLSAERISEKSSILLFTTI